MKMHKPIHSRSSGPLLFFDVTSTIRSGLNTGVQRVVRALIGEMETLSASLGMPCVPIMYHFDGFYTLRDAQMIVTPEQTVDFPEITFRYRDIYLNADAFWTQGMTDWYQYLNERGVTVATVIYDLIPITHPQFVDAETVAEFETALTTVVARSDMLMSISRASQTALENWYAVRGFEAPLPKRRVIPLGPTLTEPAAGDVSAFRLPDGAFFLAVGTLEPRRGYSEMLRDFERYWDEGGAATLLIVGKKGGASDAIEADLARLQATGRPLSWRNDMGDTELRAAYRAAEAVICASQVEGYGLPVAEGLALNGRVFANRLPVFGEFAGALPYYFDTARPGDLSRLLHDAANLPLATCKLDNGSWSQTAREIGSHLADVSPSHGSVRVIEQNTLTHEAIRWAYWLMFGRRAEPEAIETWMQLKRVDSFWSAFLRNILEPDMPLTDDLVRLAGGMIAGKTEMPDEEAAFWREKAGSLKQMRMELFFHMMQPEAPLSEELVRFAYAFKMNNYNVSPEEVTFWLGRCGTLGDLQRELSFLAVNQDAPLTDDLVRMGAALLLGQSVLSPEQISALRGEAKTLSALRRRLMGAAKNKEDT